MSESVAVWPFFMTCVESLTLSWSDSWFFDLSILSTLPVTSELLELLEEPSEPDELEPEPSEPDDPDDEPLPIEPEPVDPEEPDEPVLPMEPDDPDDPPLADWPAAGSAMSRPAIPRPATIPLLIFIVFPSRPFR